MVHLIFLVVSCSLLMNEGESPSPRIPPAFPVQQGETASASGRPAAALPGAAPPGQARIPGVPPDTTPDADPGSAKWVLQRMSESDSPELRRRAAETWPISEEDANTLRSIVPRLSDPAQAVQTGARQRLAEVEPSLVFAYAMRTMSSGALEEVKALDAALPTLGDILNPFLLETLRTELETPQHRRIAAYCLGRTGARDAAGLLEENLRAEDADLAKTCLDALVTLLPPGTTPTWLALLDHPDPYFKTQAVRSLAALGEPNSFDTLRLIVLGQAYPDLQATAFRAMREYPPEAFLPLLVEIMEVNPDLAPTALQMLRKQTGMDWGRHPGPWREWLNRLMSGPPSPLVPGR